MYNLRLAILGLSDFSLLIVQHLLLDFWGIVLNNCQGTLSISRAKAGVNHFLSLLKVGKPKAATLPSLN